MRNVAKIASIAAFGGIALASSLAPAHAFQLPAPTANLGAGRQAASAYAEDGQGPASGSPSLLSPGEVRHITWCAARYRLAYDAVNDTYIEGGVSSKCIAPGKQ